MFPYAWLNWLLIEGIVPLFGASLLYLLFGVAKKIVATGAFNFAWREACDPIGWLYGTLIISVQSVIRGLPKYEANRGIILACGGGGLACAILLVAAMYERGAASTAAGASYSPRWYTSVASAGLTICVLYTGTQIYRLATG